MAVTRVAVDPVILSMPVLAKAAGRSRSRRLSRLAANPTSRLAANPTRRSETQTTENRETDDETARVDDLCKSRC